MIYLGYLILLIYCYQVYTFSRGWNKLVSYSSHNYPKLSVVIAFRDEEKNIPFLLKDLAKQDYPIEHVEFIFVDDFSTDNSMNLLKASNLNLKILQSDIEGKKASINLGVKSSKHNIILTTDADCRISSKWISQMMAPFDDAYIHMVSGPVAYTNLYSFFDKCQAVEFMSLIGSAAGAIGVGKAFMCNGANMAFRKTIFSSTNEHIASGDDVFLLHHIKKNNGKVTFVKDALATVYTDPKPNLSSFINQRKRWASKSTSYQDLSALWISGIVFLSNLFLLILLITTQFKTLLIFFLIKSLVDYAFINQLSYFFFFKKYLSYFWILTLIYPLYIVWVAISSQLSTFEWKGRKRKQ